MDVYHQTFMQSFGGGDANAYNTGHPIDDICHDGAYLGSTDINRSYDIAFFHVPSSINWIGFGSLISSNCMLLATSF
jgi:hypothetical protein